MTDGEQQGIDVLLFEAAGARLGTDAGSVVRVSRALAEASPAAEKPRSGAQREIMTRTREGEIRPVSVDAILGVRRVRSQDLRPLPGFLRGVIHPAVIGFAFLDEALIALVDLADMAGAGEGSSTSASAERALPPR